MAAYESGAAPNGVLQLIGNVWEWTFSDYQVEDECGRTVVGDMLMKEVRGGAFDTYFAAQATSCFRTGLASLVRAHDNDPANAAPFYYMAVTRRQRGRDESPWNDTEQVAAAVAEAKRRGLERLADAPDGGEFAAFVAPVWK